MEVCQKTSQLANSMRTPAHRLRAGLRRAWATARDARHSRAGGRRASLRGRHRTVGLLRQVRQVGLGVAVSPVSPVSPVSEVQSHPSQAVAPTSTRAVDSFLRGSGFQIPTKHVLSIFLLRRAVVTESVFYSRNGMDCGMSFLFFTKGWCLNLLIAPRSHCKFPFTQTPETTQYDTIFTISRGIR